MKKFYLFICLFMFGSGCVYADSLILECPDSVNANEYFTCNIKGSTNTSVSDLSAVINLGSNLKFISFTNADNLTGDGDNGRLDLVTTNEDFTGNFDIGTLKLISSGSGDNSIIINNIFYDDINFVRVYVNDVTKTIKINNVVNDNSSSTKKSSSNASSSDVKKSSANSSSNKSGISSSSKSSSSSSKISDDINLKLLDIVISGYELDFNSDIYEYSLTIKDEDELQIEGILADKSNNLSVDGNKNLKNGSVIELKICNDDNQCNSYKINIIKEDEKKTNFSIYFIVAIGVLLVVNIVRICLKNKKEDEI